jgi:hypothetical protein
MEEMKKVDVRKVMKRAIELAREMFGDWTARMVLALRQAWKEAKSVVANERGVVGKVEIEKRIQELLPGYEVSSREFRSSRKRIVISKGFGKELGMIVLQDGKLDHVNCPGKKEYAILTPVFEQLQRDGY